MTPFMTRPHPFPYRLLAGTDTDMAKLGLLVCSAHLPFGEPTSCALCVQTKP